MMTGKCSDFQPSAGDVQLAAVLYLTMYDTNHEAAVTDHVLPCA
jgi:hypothetical protein